MADEKNTDVDEDKDEDNLDDVTAADIEDMDVDSKDNLEDDDPDDLDIDELDSDDTAMYGDADKKTEKRKRLYEDYVIDDLEDMDEAPDTGDMFDDDYLYGDDESAYSSVRKKKVVRRSIGGGALAVLWIVFVVLTVGYVYLFHINTNFMEDDTTGRDNTVNIEIPEGASYSLCTIDEINQLVNNYLLARTNADQGTLQRLVTNPTEFDDMAGIQIAAEYITGYTRTTCYMVPGYTSDSYIIYELSNLNIKDVNSNPLDIRSLYVTRQSDGTYKINNSKLSDEESAYIHDVTAAEDVQMIYKHVMENNDYLQRTDETFKKFQSMYGDN